jgi:ATP-dependent Lon protease
MKLSDYTAFPADIPIVVEDNLFLYPFMISPLFLTDEENIRAANDALDHNSLVMVCTAKVGNEHGRDFNAIYPAGVIGSIMRKVEEKS